ncbi:RagB/SusD family nutrient uptake outer membrane protein [Flammeovirga sp. EKP202]|uniref:RagB/SusD family nutrient uptake outer membrane protein n=1 Tax=Flammeovirga sp. EKP202 TaxID=2770592 RepID=UPI00165FB6A4|nr:RagB/SusD family nutrient uptake outer membrane protein [Flammeovirga sp. EKP202]MBD0403810.1 RagB/SusD family nutrient uptake outer membrane protein [Flammeovirga sp. EKP202]
MKSIKYIVLLVSSILVASCSFLNREPLGKAVDSPSYYNDSENARMAINACYNALVVEKPGKTGVFQEWNYGEVMTDNAWKGDKFFSDGLDMQDLKEWNAINTSAVSFNPYDAMFQTIHRTNTALNGIAQSDAYEGVEKDRLLGEGYFIRGYAYFYLLRLFGGVPLFTEPVKVDQIGNVQRATLEEMTAQIKSDFENAASLLGAKSEMQMGLATSGAANAYLARLIMYDIGIYKTGIGQWSDVQTYTNKVINSGEYWLADNLATIWEAEGENGPGSIFELQHETSNTGPTRNNTGTNSPRAVNPRGNSTNKGWGWGQLCPSQDLVDAFEAGDPRLEWTVGKENDHAYGKPQGLPNFEAQSGYYIRKLIMDPAIRGNNNTDHPQNQRKMRYADILLMHAEAAYHTGDMTTAQSKLNEVRQRARKMTYPMGWTKENPNGYEPRENTDVLPDITATGDELLQAILHERRVELAGECTRMWDLVRTNQYADALSKANIGYRPTIDPQTVSSRMLSHSVNGNIPVLPIPAGEVISYKLEQNPGY